MKIFPTCNSFALAGRECELALFFWVDVPEAGVAMRGVRRKKDDQQTSMRTRSRADVCVCIFVQLFFLLFYYFLFTD